MSDNIPEGQQPGTPAQPPQPPQPATITSLDQIPSALRNQLEANHKRGLQAQLAEAQEQLQQYNALKEQTAALYEMLGDKVEIPEGSDFEDVASKIGGTLESLKTEKERMEAASRKQAEALKAAQEAADGFKTRYHDTLINNALSVELGPKAVNAKAVHLISKELHGNAVIAEDGSLTFKIEKKDEDGKTFVDEMSAADAVSYLESQSDWFPFFKSTVNSGVGDDVIDNVRRNGDGSINMAEIMKDPKKFRELKEKRPDLLQDFLNSTL